MNKNTVKKTTQTTVTANESQRAGASCEEDGHQSQSIEDDCSAAAEVDLDPEPLPKNRAAFLFGFCTQLPSVDAIIEPMLAICDCTTGNKIMLLDNCLTRILGYDAELAGVPERSDDYRWGAYSIEERHRFSLLSNLRWFEVKKLRTTAASLWTGRSELRSWYLAGVALGELTVHLDESKTAAATPNANTDNQILDRACAAFRKAAKWRMGSTAIREGCDAILVVATQCCKGTGEFNNWKFGSDIALRVADVDSTCPAIEDEVREERDQLIYERMVVHGEYGQELLASVNGARKRREWPNVSDPTKLIEIARDFARRNHKPLPPERARGRKPDSEE